MPVSYSQDVLRHWSCKCSEGEALAFRTHLAMSGLELPEAVDAWAVIDGEADVASSDVAAWQHVVSACVKASNDGMSERGLAEYANVLDDLATVVNVLNIREQFNWAEKVAKPVMLDIEPVTFVPEVEAEVSAPNPPVEQVSAPPTESVNVGEVIEQAPTPDDVPTQNSEASE